MLCKKCGAVIEENSKFCGYCGNAVEGVFETINNVQSTNVEENKIDNVGLNINNSVSNIDLGETIKIDPIQPDVQSMSHQSSAESALDQQEVVNDSISITNNQTMMGNNTVNPIQENSSVMQNNVNNVSNKKNNKLIFIITGVALVLIAIVLLVFAFMKSSNTSISVLKKAFANLQERADNSVTVNGNLSLATTTGESFSFNLSSKVVEKDDKIDMQVTLEKSLLFEEMNVYATITEEEMTFYMQSSLIDMMGMTSSIDNKWIYYNLNLDELEQTEEDKELEEKIKDMKLEDFIDEEHFVFVDKVNDLRHYELIIDQKLIDNIKSKLSELNDEDINETISSMEELENTIKIDFYINDKDELSKIELDMTEYLEDTDDISSMVLSMEFTNLNSTVVEIPSDAKNSITDLETYMSSNVIITDDYNYSYDEDYYDYEYDYNYDTSVDTSLNNTIYGF